MKKIWMIFCFSLLFCSTVFFGCENKENQSEEIVLRIANWEEYLDEGGWDEDETIDLDEKTKILGRENMVDDFESWYKKTYGEKVRVEYSTFGTNEDLYNQMTLGDTLIWSVHRIHDYEVVEGEKTGAVFGRFFRYFKKRKLLQPRCFSLY